MNKMKSALCVLLSASVIFTPCFLSVCAGLTLKPITAKMDDIELETNSISPIELSPITAEVEDIELETSSLSPFELSPITAEIGDIEIGSSSISPIELSPITAEIDDIEIGSSSISPIELSPSTAAMDEIELETMSLSPIELQTFTADMDDLKLEPISVGSLDLPTITAAFDRPELVQMLESLEPIAPSAATYQIPDLSSVPEYDLSISPAAAAFSTRLQNELSSIEIDPMTASLDLELNAFCFSTSSDLLFDYDKYDLKPQGKAVLDRYFEQFASLITDDEHKGCLAYVDFGGHTDSDGSYEYNLQLSLNRSFTVYQYCLRNCMTSLTDEQAELLVDKSHVNGYSWTQPVLNASGQEDKPASRRVTIRAYFNAADITG